MKIPYADERDLRCTVNKLVGLTCMCLCEEGETLNRHEQIAYSSPQSQAGPKCPEIEEDGVSRSYEVRVK